MENVREIFQIMTRRFGFLNKNCCSTGGCDISLIQSHILYEIDHQHKPSIQQVADVLGTDITTFSRQIQSIIKMNLVKKNARFRRPQSVYSFVNDRRQICGHND